MLFTVSTVKDSRANVERFVSRNLAGGVDHVVLFLDAPEAEVESFCAEHPHVTHVVCDESYWQGARPDDLNARQVLNANLVHGVLSAFDWVTWLFQIDADEIVDFDRERLLSSVPEEQPFVLLQSTEAVSKLEWDGDVTHFKRLLTPEELQLLVALEVIDEADNRGYFRGHIHGKPGIRPGLDRRLQLHRVVDEELEPLEPYVADWIRVLHYESYDGQEFVRKWMAHVTAGPLRFRPNRERLLTALTVLVNTNGLSEEKRHHYLMKLYRRWVEDDFSTLQDLGLLFAPETRSHTPEDFPGEGLAQMRRLLAAACAVADKRGPHPQHRKQHLSDFMKLVRGGVDGSLADLVTAEIKRARTVESTRPASGAGGQADSDDAGRGGRLGGLAERLGRKG